MANTFNSGTASQIQTLLATIARMLGISIDLTNSASFRATLDSPDGTAVNFTCEPDTIHPTAGVVPPGAGTLAARVLGLPAAAIQGDIAPPTSATATLVAGTKTFTLANNVGDALCVQLVASGGTAGILSVARASATTVTVDSWVSGTGIQTLDTSTVIVYNFGAP